MVHVVQGRIVEKRSLFRLSIFTDLFWGIVNTISNFFETMLSMEKANAYRQTGKTTSKRSNTHGFGNNNGYGGGGGRPGGGGGGRPGGGGVARNRGPRIAGIKDFKSSGNIPGGG